MTKQQYFIPCIFCGGKGVSKEHIWPKWLRSEIKITDTYYHETRNRSVPYSAGINTQRTDNWKFYFNKTSRTVCKSCNNGWMSRLQTLAKPILVKLIQGDNIQLDTEKQEILAKWITMTSIMGEFMNPKQRGISPETLASFYKTGQTPSNCHIWLGRNSYKSLDEFKHRTTSFSIDDGKSPLDTVPGGNAHFSTLIIGNLYICALTLPVNDFQISQRAMVPEKLEQLWPMKYQNFVWGIRSTMGLEDFNKFSDFTNWISGFTDTYGFN